MVDIHPFRFRMMLLGCLWIPVMVVSILWVRSYHVHDIFSRHSEIARWPNGKEQPAFPGVLIHEGLLGNRAIYTLREETLESCAGGIKLHLFSRNDDLGNPAVFKKFVATFQGAAYPIIPVWSLNHFAYWGRYDSFYSYPQLKVPGDNPTWDVRYKSTGDWSQQHQTETLFEFVMPYWFLVLVVSIPTLGMFAVLFQKVRRRIHNKCVRCGYDLRATPDRCPECGTPVPNIARRGTTHLRPK